MCNERLTHEKHVYSGERMPTFCIQCAMEDLLADRAVRVHDESLDDHMRRVHPDQAETQARRRELEDLLQKKFGSRDPFDPRR